MQQQGFFVYTNNHSNAEITHTMLIFKALTQNHRLRGSGSTIVMMTSKVNGKTEILTPCRNETPENIEAELGVNNYD